jgi:hypothetical protein
MTQPDDKTLRHKMMQENQQNIKAYLKWCRKMNILLLKLDSTCVNPRCSAVILPNPWDMQEYYWWSKDSLLFPNEELMMSI